MRQRQLRILSMSLLVVTVMCEMGAVALSWGLEPAYDTAMYALYGVCLAGAGAVITWRYPRHAIGWMFLGFALLSAATSDLAQGWGLRAAQQAWPAGPAGEWIALWSWLPSGLGWILTFVLFPDGHLLGRRWRLVAWCGVVGTLLAVPGWSLAPASGSYFVNGENPLALEWFPASVALALGMTLFLSALVASVVALALRFKRAQGVERLQLEWFVFAAVLAGVALPLSFAFWDVVPIVRPLAAIALTALPIAAGIAIVRHHLYDIDVVINRTLVYGVLCVVLAAVYVASAVILGVALGHDSSLATAGATLAIAACFRPLRARVQELVDRRFNRAHYDAMHRTTAFLDDLGASRVEPEAIEELLREIVSDPVLELCFEFAESEVPVTTRGVPILDEAQDQRERFPIVRGGVRVGVVLSTPSTPADRSLLVEVVEAGGLAIEITRLRVELRRQLEQVGASRARIVAAGDQERRRIERNLHDGAQQRLVSIGLALRHVQHEFELGSAPEAYFTLDRAVDEIAVTINELRELARGIRPAQLDAGLASALRALADRSLVTVQVHATKERFADDVETAAYFIACEGLTNAVKHANADAVVVRVERVDDLLFVSISDDGVGGAVARAGSGLMGLIDRVGAQGGRFLIESPTGSGTRLTAELPCAS